MSQEKVLRILKMAAMPRKGKVSFVALPNNVIGVTVSGVEEREKRTMLACLDFEAAEWGYKLMEVVEA